METATVDTRPATGAGSATIADLLPAAAKNHGSGPAVMYRDESGKWTTRSFAEVGEVVRWLSLGLIDLGVQKGDKVSILANTRPEWTYFDFAALSAGATVVPIYQTNSPEECQYVLENSDAKVVIVEDAEQLDEDPRRSATGCPKLEHVILMTGSSDDAISDGRARRARRLARRRPNGRSAGARSRPTTSARSSTRRARPGRRRAACISHGNYRAMLDMVAGAERARATARHLSLPAARALLRAADPAAQLRRRRHARLLGARSAEDPPQPGRGQAPLLPLGAAHLREDLHGGECEGRQGGRRAEARSSTGRSASAGSVRELERARQEPVAAAAPQHAIADRLVLSNIRDLFGGRIIEAVSGAAPINPEILRFFDAAGVLVLEGWGMTETSTAATISTPGRVQVRDDRQAVPGLRGEDRRRRRDPGARPERLPGLLQERGGDPGDARRRLAAHRRPRRGRRGRLPQDHRPQEGHHHHRRAARTSPRRTSRPRSSSSRWSRSAS